MSALHFLLNDREIQTDAHPGTLVLDFLRDQALIKGTKEGCREGDCGACVVLIGALTDTGVVYRQVTSCLVPIGSLHGKHLVTIEGLNVNGLSPVQEAIVLEGGSQCGFCTPGIVVSITGALIRKSAALDREEVKEALGGHLCRCTGYRSLTDGYRQIRDRLGETKSLSALTEAGFIPLYFNDIEGRLKNLAPRVPLNGEMRVEHRIAGGTDLYVQRGDELSRSSVELLERSVDSVGIVDHRDHLEVAAGTTFEDFSSNAAVRNVIPEIKSYMHQIASLQIRNLATLGGNVINASPIGDMTILLLALESVLVLRGREEVREVQMTAFYEGYKVMDRRPDEVLTRILIPKPPASARIGWEKVSKRKTLDIATVNLAMVIDENAGVITRAGLAVGGVAPIPLYLKETVPQLIGLDVSPDTVRRASEMMQDEIAPISDIRGSADYKRLLARQLLFASFLKLFPEELQTEAFV